ncbi:MAG: methylmalonyl-CoA mutase family protein [Pseudomonadota bacterium]
MTETIVSLGDQFQPSTEAEWVAAVEKALKGKGPDALVRQTLDGIPVHPLYREPDHPAQANPDGMPGQAPFLRGAEAQRDAYLPWDIRQAFAHPDPAATNADILRDLARGVSSIELCLDCTGKTGVAAADPDTFAAALSGVRGDIATIALDHGGDTGVAAAALLARWGEDQREPKAQKFAFNIDPLGALQRSGLVEGGIDGAMGLCAGVFDALALKYPHATVLRVDARPVHEAGGSEAQELGALIAHGIDTLRRLDAFGISPAKAAPQILFTLSIGANYGIEIAKLRAARRLWARCLEALGLDPSPMKLQAVTSARMLTRYDAWVNMLRGTSACFAAAVGGADVITVRAFNEALGVPDELGRRIARNTQIIAMEESQLGRVADPAGGAWFTGTLGSDLAELAWSEFQRIEGEGGFGASLMEDAFQARVAKTRAQRIKDVARRKIPVTGVSEFPLLEEITPTVADISFSAGAETIDPSPLAAIVPTPPATGDDSQAEPLWPIRIAEPFERLRDHAEARTAKTGDRPAVFLATLGPLAEHTARVDFAKNLFAAGGIDARAALVTPTSTAEMVAAFKASDCRLAVLCGSDKRYEAEAAAAAAALKEAGVQRLYLAGKYEADGIDSHIFMGVDLIDTLELAHAELGIVQ